MVNNDAIVSIVKQISDLKGPPCKKTLQKIVFLVEAKNIDLGCDYGIHFYGPYSADLDFAVRELSDNDVLKIEYTDSGHNISIADSANINEYSDEAMEEVVQEFANDSPSNLELLATALYVYTYSDKQCSAIMNGVVKIKGNKYSTEQINAAITRLRGTGYVA